MTFTDAAHGTVRADGHRKQGNQPLPST
jgi:hypothetical protein